MICTKPFILASAISLALLMGCSSNDTAAELDTQAPTLEVIQPLFGAYHRAGEPLLMRVTATDNDALAQLRVEAYYEGDGHSHKEQLSWTWDTTWQAANAASIMPGTNPQQDITTWRFEATPPVPLEAQAGQYALHAQALDESGNASPLLVSDVYLYPAEAPRIYTPSYAVDSGEKVPLQEAIALNLRLPSTVPVALKLTCAIETLASLSDLTLTLYEYPNITATGAFIADFGLTTGEVKLQPKPGKPQNYTLTADMALSGAWFMAANTYRLIARATDAENRTAVYVWPVQPAVQP